jgi:PhnB protein
MPVEPYLFFNGRCEEAIEFYKRALGATDVQIMRYKDSPEKPPPGMVPPGSDNKVMHSNFKVGGTNVMASDGDCSGKLDFKGISLSVTAANDAEADRLFAALADGGKIQMPIGKTFFASRFGMVADKFGVSWMVIAGAG